MKNSRSIRELSNAFYDALYSVLIGHTTIFSWFSLTSKVLEFVATGSKSSSTFQMILPLFIFSLNSLMQRKNAAWI